MLGTGTNMLETEFGQLSATLSIITCEANNYNYVVAVLLVSISTK